MIPFLIGSALVALAVVGFLIFQVWGRNSSSAQHGPTRSLIPLDLDAFQNLTDPEEEQYLREHLSQVEFRKAQRVRIRAAKLYVAALSENASILVAVGQSARLHASPEIAASGEQIVQKALRLKAWCILALMRLNTGLLFPTLLSPSNTGASHYQTVKYMAANLPGDLAA